MKAKKTYTICRNDIILTAAMALTALVLFILFLTMHGHAAGNTVYITLEGREYGRYPLDSDITLEIKSDGGNNILEIKDGKVSMIEADCPDGYCVSTGKIFRNGETIVCLPHRLVVEIRSLESPSDEFDLIAQ